MNCPSLCISSFLSRVVHLSVITRIVLLASFIETAFVCIESKYLEARKLSPPSTAPPVVLPVLHMTIWSDTYYLKV
jgi:hypothetical protein